MFKNFSGDALTTMFMTVIICLVVCFGFYLAFLNEKIDASVEIQKAKLVALPAQLDHTIKIMEIKIHFCKTAYETRGDVGKCIVEQLKPPTPPAKALAPSPKKKTEAE